MSEVASTLTSGMDPVTMVVIGCFVMLVILYLLSLILRSGRKKREEDLSKVSGEKSTSSKPKTPTKSLTKAAKREIEKQAYPDDGHSIRWHDFVTKKLQNVVGEPPSKLPGIGPAGEKLWISYGCPSALAVVATYFKEGGPRFRKVCENEVGMKKGKTDYVDDLCTALETKLNSLTLLGSSLEDLKKNQKQVGDHSIRWGTFVNCKLSELTMDDLPGVGDKFRQSWIKAGFKTPTQVLGQFVFLGRARFEEYCSEAIGMRKIGTNDNIYELASGLETKWNSLLLSGTE